MKTLLCLMLAAICLPAHAADKPKNAKADAQFEQLFSNVDTDQNGTISRAEAELKAPAMAEAFDQIDTDHDQQLSKQEIKAFTAKLLRDREEFAHRLEAADKDKNGKLSREESKSLPKLYANFDAIDANHDGQLDVKEISDYLRAKLEERKAAAQ